MKLSEIIREYVEAKIEGPPQRSDYSSIEVTYQAKARYQERLRELEEMMDAVVPALKGQQS